MANTAGSPISGLREGGRRTHRSSLPKTLTLPTLGSSDGSSTRSSAISAPMPLSVSGRSRHAVGGRPVVSKMTRARRQLVLERISRFVLRALKAHENDDDAASMGILPIGRLDASPLDPEHEQACRIKRFVHGLPWRCPVGLFSRYGAAMDGMTLRVEANGMRCWPYRPSPSLVVGTSRSSSTRANGQRLACTISRLPLIPR